MKNLYKNSIFLLIILLLATILTGCKSNKETETYTTLEELKNKRIGIQLSASSEEIIREKFPDAEVFRFNDLMEAVAAVQAGQVDAAMVSYPVAFLCKKNNPDLTWVEEPVANSQASIGFKKGNAELVNQVNSCIDKLKEEGMLDDMVSRWYDMENPSYSMPKIDLPTEGSPLIIGVAADREPSTFLASNGDIIGLDAELALRIGQYLNCPVKFENMKLAAFSTALESGKVDMIISNFIITEELKQTIDASKPYFDTPRYMIVRKGK